MTFSRFVVVTGLSGAGKTQAMKSFEDLGFYCLDNLPPALVPELVTLAERAGIERVALSLDARVQGAFGDVSGALDALERRGVALELLFLDAGDDAIVRRYSETRRRHPRENGAGKLADTLATMRARATAIWDTSRLTHAALKERIAETFAPRESETLAIRIVAYGFKFGIPIDADLAFDVRFFPNPNYVPELKERTGVDPEVAAFLEALPDMAPFLERLFGLVDFLVPRYRDEGKARLTIAIGCTGGRHRSVYVAKRLEAHLARRDGTTVACDFRELATS